MTGTLTSLLRIYLPLYVFLFFVISFLLPSYRIWRHTGINPVTFGKDDSAHSYIGLVMKALIVLLFANVVIYAIGSEIYVYLVPIWYLEIPVLDIIGLVLIHFSLAWIMVAQYQMSNNWRIGIDEKNKTKLVKNGVFNFSRNPVFLGMMVSMLGLFLILPNVLSFFLTVGSFIIIQVQVRLEEEFLSRQHGKLYEDYKLRTRRWL
jgi:protein-S-isoprenylcysteine O-methyltransferase Ste14